ncbi:hypothetical protein ACCT04_34875, partial [Rhizobium ruizarguesonis]
HVSREFTDDADELRRAATIGRMIDDVLSGRKRLPEVISTRARNRKKSKAFVIPPSVNITNSLSNKFTVIEVERPPVRCGEDLGVDDVGAGRGT